MLASLAWQGCAAEVDGTPPSTRPEPAGEADPAELYVQGDAVEVELVRELLPGWAGEELGLEWPTTYFVGPAANLTRASQGVRRVDEVLRELLQRTGPLAMAALWRGSVFLIDLQPSAELDLRVEDHLDREIDRLIAAHALTPDFASEPPAQPIDGEIGVTWQPLVTDNQDTRRPLHLPDNAAPGEQSYAQDNWLGAIGLLKDNTVLQRYCTGTLVGPVTPGAGFFARIVLTAAHCLVKDDGAGGQDDVVYEFYPRADSPAGGTPVHPWGDWTVQGTKFFPPEFVANNCHVEANYTLESPCITHDWAIVRYVRPPESLGHENFFRYRTFPNDQWNGVRNRGYPNCAEMDAPDQCIPEALYGDDRFCVDATTEFFGDLQCDPMNPSQKCFRAKANIVCDASGGHSGGPVYRYIKQRPTIGGIFVGDDDSNKNFMRRVTLPMASQINNFVSMP
jgi:hypothetical protein